jgi:hypothetical protein
MHNIEGQITPFITSNSDGKVDPSIIATFLSYFLGYGLQLNLQLLLYFLIGLVNEPNLHGSSQGKEGILDILPTLGTALSIVGPIVLCELASFLEGDLPFLQIRFIANNKDGSCGGGS